MSAARPAASRFYGTWTLARWELLRNGELDAYPHGADGQGRLILTAQGAASAVFQRKDWGAVDVGERPSRDRFIAYAGEWRVQDGLLLLHISFASEPRWIEQTFARKPSFPRGAMVLESPEQINARGQRVASRATWIKGLGESASTNAEA